MMISPSRLIVSSSLASRSPFRLLVGVETITRKGRRCKTSNALDAFFEQTAPSKEKPALDAFFDQTSPSKKKSVQDSVVASTAPRRHQRAFLSLKRPPTRPSSARTSSRSRHMRGHKTRYGTPPNNISNGMMITRKTVAEHLEAAGERVCQTSTILVQGIPPVSSLQAMMDGIHRALEELPGVPDLDAEWDLKEGEGGIPFLQLDHHPGKDDEEPIVKRAILLLSPFGRPTGWKLELQNRSIAHALINAQFPIQCAWKAVTLNEWKELLPKDNLVAATDLITEATLRVENFPKKHSTFSLLNLFSRFDLRETGGPAIECWQGQTSDGRSPRSTWLVHFADASWARAALREKQHVQLEGHSLVLAPYPKQIL